MKNILIIFIVFLGVSSCKTLKNKSKENNYTDSHDIQIATRKISNSEVQKTLELLELITKQENRETLNGLLEKFELEVSSNSNDENYFLDIINNVIDEVSNTEIEFIVRLDSGFPLDEFKFVIADLVKNNFLEIKLNDQYDKSSEFAITGTEVFRDFDKDLGKYKLKLGFIESDSDDYILFIHPTKNTNEIKEKAVELGLEYFGSEDT